MRWWRGLSQPRQPLGLTPPLALPWAVVRWGPPGAEEPGGGDAWGPAIRGGSFVSGSHSRILPKQPVPTVPCCARGEMACAAQLNSHCRLKYLCRTINSTHTVSHTVVLAAGPATPKFPNRLNSYSIYFL